MPERAQSPFIRDLVYAERHGLLGDEVGRAMLRVVQAGVSDGYVDGVIRDRVAKHRIASAFEGPFAMPALRTGELVQGLDARGERVHVPIQSLNAHSLTLAGSGAGKSIKAQFHALQVARHVRGLWLFDCRKSEWKTIRDLLQRLGVDLIVLPARGIRVNPLQTPRHVDPADWAARVAALLVQTLVLPGRAAKVIEILVQRLYEEMNVFGGSQSFPTLFDLFEAAKADRSLNAAARQAILDSVEPLLLSLGPEVLAYRVGWDANDLAALPLNFVLNGVPEAAQNLLLGTLLLSVFTARVSRGVSNRPMDLYVSVDEGQRLIAASTARVNALTDLWPLVRGTGIGLDLTIPASHGVMPEALSFAATKYLGRCGSGSDYDLFARAMGLSKEQVRHAIEILRPGRFIVQSGELEWRRPYVLDIPSMKPSRAGANDSERTRNQPAPVLRALPVVPAGRSRWGVV